MGRKSRKNCPKQPERQYVPIEGHQYTGKILASKTSYPESLSKCLLSNYSGK